jgi:hypothetical protein
MIKLYFEWNVEEMYPVVALVQSRCSGKTRRMRCQFLVPVQMNGGYDQQKDDGCH